MKNNKGKATAEQVEKAITEAVAVFTKQQLLKSEKYANRQDAINALLEDNKRYTLDQVDEILEQFYKGGKK